MVDLCTTDEVHLTTPNGVAVAIHINEFNPDKDMEVTTEFYPAGSDGEKIYDDWLNKKSYYYKIGTRSSSNVLGRYNLWMRVHIPPNNVLKYYEKIKKTSPLWTIRVSWSQDNMPGRESVAHLNFYRTDGTPAFYRPISNLCWWQGNAQVSSRLYKNESNAPLTVTRHYAQYLMSGSNSGFSLGGNPWSRNASTTSSTPLIETPLEFNGNWGWYFNHWDRSYEEQTENSITRQWNLGPNEAAVLVSRNTYLRQQVEKWEWKIGGNRCGRYEIVDEGNLDIEYSTEDLVTIPEEYYGGPEMIDFINAQNPAMNNCEDPHLSPADSTDVIESKQARMYFYGL